MTSTAQARILVVGVGGLGTAVVNEAWERGTEVSVLVRDDAKLRARFGDAVAHLASVTVGDATNPAVLDEAMQNVDVVVSGNGAHPKMAQALAEGARRNGVTKLIWPAGSTNLMEDDGRTPVYTGLLDMWPGAADAYRAHQLCIDAIRETGINYVIWAPGVDACGRSAQRRCRLHRAGQS